MEIELCSLFFDVVNGRYQFQSHEQLERLKSSYVYPDGKKRAFKDVKYHSFFPLRMKYLIENGTLNAAVVVHHLQHLLRDFSDNLDLLPFRKRRMSICCLGGGPATDAVAIIKVLGDFYDDKAQGIKHLYVTIIDINPAWIRTAGSVIERLQMMNSKRFRLHLSFLEADLSQPMSPEVSKAINFADVLTMLNFMSSIETATKDQLNEMKAEILRKLKPGGCLLFIDSSSNTLCEQMATAASKCVGLRLIYGPKINELHTLSLTAIEKHLELYFKKFGFFPCTTECAVSVAMWMKTEEQDEDTSEAAASNVPAVLDRKKKKSKKAKVQSKRKDDVTAPEKSRKEIRGQLHRHHLEVKQLYSKFNDSRLDKN